MSIQAGLCNWLQSSLFAIDPSILGTHSNVQGTDPSVLGTDQNILGIDPCVLGAYWVWIPIKILGTDLSVLVH